MIKRIIFLFFWALITSISFAQSSHSGSLPKLKWQKEKITKGLIWKWAHTTKLFNSKQFINTLAINKKRAFSIDFETSTLKPTSQFGKEEQALAAVNAGFFNMKEGGSVTFLKVDDEVINPHSSQSEAITRSCIAVDEKGRLVIEKARPLPYYEKPEHYEDVLFTGPLLIVNGVPQQLSDRSFNTARHPRTCACLKKNGNALLMTIDGRNEEAQGMSLYELTELLLEMKCYQAINLDGGGSTTMWINGEGIVNHPSDNKKFDHEGERQVANVIVIK